MFSRRIFNLNWLVGLIVLSLVISACTAAQPAELPGTGGNEAAATETVDTPEAVSHGGEIGGYIELVDALRAAGAEVEPAGSIKQDFFEPEAQMIRVNGADVQVFEFAGEEAAQQAAATISLDGSSIGATMVTWVDEPHFWARGRVIVLYVGSDQAVVDLLTNVMGAPLVGS